MRLLLAFFLLAAAPAFAQDADFDQAVRDTLSGDPAEYRQVIGAFQQAVRDGDAAAAAALVSYPIAVTVAGDDREIGDADAFAAAFPEIVTPAIAAAVLDQAIGDMFVNAEGVMLGDGEVWVSGVCLDDACARSEVRVITIQSGP